MDFGGPLVEALVRDRLDDLRRQARVCALARRPSPRRRARAPRGAVVLGRTLARLGAALVALGRRIGGEAVCTVRP